MKRMKNGKMLCLLLHIKRNINSEIHKLREILKLFSEIQKRKSIL
jgi:hypothetical protein